MIPNKIKLASLLIIWLTSLQLCAQSNFSWGVYTQLGQGNISEIYEWRNYLCFEACSSEGHKGAFSYEVGLTGQLAVGRKAKILTTLGYSRFNYIEEESWSDGAGFYIRDTRRQLQHLTLGLGLQHQIFSWGNQPKQLYMTGGLLGMWNANQEVDFGLINFEGTIGEWNAMAEIGLGVSGSIGKMQWLLGPNFRFALNNFAKPLEESNRNTPLDQLRPRELGLRMTLLFP